MSCRGRLDGAFRFSKGHFILEKEDDLGMIVVIGPHFRGWALGVRSSDHLKSTLIQISNVGINRIRVLLVECVRQRS